MRELELNTIMGVVADPENCAVSLEDRKLINDIQRIMRIFEINKNEHISHKMFALKNMASFRLVLSNN